MTLKNDKQLILSPVTVEDAKELIKYLGEVFTQSDNMMYTPDEFKMTVSEEEKFIEGIINHKSSTMIIGRVDGKIICNGTIITQPREKISHIGNLALSVTKEYWGMGAGGYLMDALIDFARNNGETSIVHLGVKAENITAINLYKKYGFIEIGRFNRYFKIGNEYYDLINMNLYL